MADRILWHEHCERCPNPLRRGWFELSVSAKGDSFKVKICAKCADDLRDWIYPQFAEEQG